MNNKKIFSVNLFWQSFKQLKAIGIICTVISFILAVLPIAGEAISIEIAKDSLGSAFAENYSYPQIVNVVESTSFMIITFVVFAPLLALNCWKFLNKRNTSDFYHSLPYRRICLFLSKLAAVFAWLLVMYLISGVGTTASYMIFSKYFIVDYYIIFRMYLSMFICCILCVAGISLSCSFTGNMLTNVCMTGVILFLPRALIYIIGSSIASSVYVLNAENVIPMFGNSANMITSIVLDAIFGESVYSLQSMILSPVSNIYTLVLGLIYIAVAAVLFITRKSECAGKSAIGKASRFFIRMVLCFSICAIMVLPVLCNQESMDNLGRIYYIILSFIVAGVALVVYECIQSKNIKSVMACFPAMAGSYVLTLIIGAIFNVWAAGILEYNPKMEDVNYITLVQSSSRYTYYYSGSGLEYFNCISKDIKIEDKKIINEVCKAIESNANLVKEGKIENIIYTSDSSKRCIAYDVYIKDGVIGHNRKVYLSQEAIKLISENMHNVESYKEAYLDLPAADKVDFGGCLYGMTTEQKKTVYNTLLEEIKTMKFSDWYENVNSNDYSYSILITFSKNGYVYSADIPVTEKLPKTAAAMFKEFNVMAEKDKEMLDKLVNKLELAKEGNLELKKDVYEDISISVESLNDVNGIYTDVLSYMSESPDIAPKTIEKFIQAIKNKNYNKNFDANRAYVMISYYCEDPNDIYKSYYISYYIQLDGYDDISDYGVDGYY